MTKRDDGKKLMNIKEPSKKRIGGVEENNVTVLVGGVPCDSQGICSLSFFHYIEGLLEG